MCLPHVFGISAALCGQFHPCSNPLKHEKIQTPLQHAHLVAERVRFNAAAACQTVPWRAKATSARFDRILMAAAYLGGLNIALSNHPACV